MADTRTIYLITPDDVFCSDPKPNTGTYLDMSEYDNLNPTRGTIVSGLAGAVSTYEPYDVTITLTFTNRQERAEWIQKNGDRVYQIAVANTINQNRVYNKKCAITSFEFLENSYTNGIQTIITLKLFGKWQSSLTKIAINSGTYEGGTKEYTSGDVSPFYYTYNSDLRYGVTHYVSAIELNGEHGFVLNARPVDGGLTVTMQSDFNRRSFALESNWPSLITGLSTDFVAYPYTSFTLLDQFTMLDGGTVTSYGWNIENEEMPYLYDMLNNVDKYPISVGAVTQNGVAVPIDVYTYTSQDFI